MKAWSLPKISSVAPRLFPKGLEADAYRFTGIDTSTPWFSPADAIKAPLYCSEPFVD